MGKETNIKQLAVREIDKIVKSKAFNAHGLAKAYIDGKFPEKLPFYFDYYRRTHEGIKKRLGKKTLSDLNNNYGKDTVENVFEALSTFSIFLKKPDFDIWATKEALSKALRHFRQSASRVIKATDILLKEAGSTAAEKKAILKIKTRHENGLKYFSQKKTVTVDAFKEIMLGFGPSTLPNIRFNYLTFPDFIAEWEKEYIKSVWQIFIKKPKSRPQKIIENALLIVIFNLLKRDDRQIKWLYLLTTDIVKQCFNKKIGLKAVENALHST